MAITLIACVDINNGIGDAEGNLLYKIKKDMKHFKSITSGKIVVMGRKTWDSLPKKPLEKRKNYVLTMDESFDPVGAKVLHDINEVIELGKKHDVYVIGGGEIYYQTIDFADKLILTHVHEINTKSRVFFPDVDYRVWKLKNIQEHDKSDEHDFTFAFATYEKKK
ncbi:dihydrofolate reductase [Bacillus velezensis]|uniref:dihydrofolate reductase n=1 Tax=Bacillus velezensis TaxID=492670 RepID=UPI0018C63D49|nr:dihydrofolate reductase [Bacillus velezensis]QPK89701.1 dihydrofolate reductase [Bacillus velezensis]